VTAPLPLRTGPLTVSGFTVRRSGIRWLREDGHLCRPGEVVAYCNIRLAPIGRPDQPTDPFAEERRDFQVAFGVPAGGRLRKAAGTTRGGLVDQLPFAATWSPDFVIGRLDEAAGPAGEPLDGELRLLFLAGRRVTELTEMRSGLLSGWHERSRAWWGDRADPFGTVLSLGNCEQQGVVRGEQNAFLELLEAVEGPAHAVLTADLAMVPSSTVVLEQLRRTPAEFAAIGQDFARTFSATPTPPAPGDWIFGALLLSALGRSPLSEEYDMLDRGGLKRAGPPDAVILSLGAELPIRLRHRRLGYALNCNPFRILEAGPAARAWLQSNFEPVRLAPDQIAQDYRDLIDAARARHPAHFVIMNLLSSSNGEDIQNYAGFDTPLRNTLTSVRAKELNLMLHDLARERDVSIIDVDTIAADLGTLAHVPDGLHHSGLMQAEIRGEILRVLRVRGVPGFAR
jgi:hypothetical protein